MKIWFARGSEHSANLVMIGHFRDADAADKAKMAIDALIEYESKRHPAGQLDDFEAPSTFSDELLAVLQDVGVYSIGPEELEQLALDFRVEIKGSDITIRTDEVEISALVKILISKGARIQIFSADRE